MKSQIVETEIVIDRDGVEMEVTARFDFTPACRGHRDRYGAPEEPDEPEDLEFVDAGSDGVEVELTDGEIERAKDRLFEQLAERRWDN